MRAYNLLILRVRKLCGLSLSRSYLRKSRSGIISQTACGLRFTDAKAFVKRLLNKKPEDSLRVKDNC